MEYNLGDKHGNFGIITRMTDKYIWFGDKRYLKSSFHKKKLDVIFKQSPDANIDWKNAEEVDKYYLTFLQWAGVVRMGDSRTRQIFKVENNKIFHNGEYYLPYYSKIK